MGNTTIVTSKVPKELKEKAKKLGINISKVLRRALEEEVRKREEELFKKSVNEAARILRNVDIDKIIKSVREDRGQR
ncbi:MAG: type II toxin-antitoxin system CcdA family antitoxin [Candidatus Njordarchaeia archaeon]